MFTVAVGLADGTAKLLSIVPRDDTLFLLFGLAGL